MCGFIGVNKKCEQPVDRALELMAYRGPDARGVWSDFQATLGHNRLSIIDLDPRSSQPMVDVSGRYRIIFNGEIYNFAALKAELAPKYGFITTSDTEVILAGYILEGTAFFGRLSGMYALAIYDQVGGKLVLARDQSGIKPLYFYEQDGLFVFGSEMKAVASLVRDQGRELAIDREALALYYLFGYIPSPRTLASSIAKLPAGSVYIYDLDRRHGEIGKIETAYQRVEGLRDYAKMLEDRVLAHLVADVPVGIFFSGGTDSSLIAAILHKHGVDLQTYSVRMAHKGEDEGYFRQIIDKLELKHRIFDFGQPEFEAALPAVMARLDEPLSDTGFFPLFHLSKMTASETTAVLSGEGGDEYFYGYARHRYLAAMAEARDPQIDWLDRLYQRTPYFKIRSPLYLDKTRLFKALFFWFKRPYSFYLAETSISKGLLSLEPAKRLIVDQGLSPLRLDQALYLENDLLKKADLATMYNSQETRVPLLDPAVIGNSGQFEDSKREGGVGKAVLKKLLTAYLPPELVYRGKSGFDLDLSRLFRESAILRNEFSNASALLDKAGLLPLRADPAWMRDHPHFAYSLIALRYSLENNGFVLGK